MSLSIKKDALLESDETPVESVQEPENGAEPSTPLSIANPFSIMSKAVSKTVKTHNIISFL
jgi:hypothetical protein